MHSKYSPSSAYRWTTCTASIPYVESLNLPEQPSSAAAARGTFLHSVREKVLKHGTDLRELIGMKSSDGEILTEDDANALEPGIERIRSLYVTDTKLHVEHKIDLSPWILGGFGTADAVIVDYADRIVYIDDYKSGSMPVSPENNLQLTLYAAGVLVATGIRGKVVLSIDQPACGGIRTHEMTAEEVLAVAEAVAEVVSDIEAGKTVFMPSEDNCHWCPAFAHCPENRKRNLQLMGFAGKTPKLPTKMTARQRSKILRWRTEIERWLQALHDDAMRDALAGKKVPGFKVVEGRRGNRRWADDVAAEAELQRLLGERAYSTSLISPAQAEKRLGDAIPATIQPPGKPILVGEDDERPSMVLFGN